MIIIYYILALIIFVIGAIPLVLFCFKAKYKHSIPARFFLFKNPKFKPYDVHFHACSFGEIRSIAPILRQFENIAVSVITKTGFDEAKKITPNTRFLPYEIFLPFWLRGSKILVIFEAELWLMLVFIAKIKGSRVILINARISDRSYKRYLKFGFLYQKIFKFIDKIYAQSEIDKARLEELGARDVVVSGNIKSAFLPKPSKIYAKPSGRLIVLASTHRGEEEILLEWLNLEEKDRLVVVPRHPERFDEAHEILKKFALKNGFEYAKFSRTQNFNAKCTLLDAMGELVNVYAISDVVILGGSFVPNVGGHNPIEAAQFNNVIITGEFIFNQKTLFEQVDDVIFAKPDELRQLLGKELKTSKIRSIGSASEIIKDIKDSCERGKSI